MAKDSHVDWSVDADPEFDQFRKELRKLGPAGKDWRAKLAEVNEANAYIIAAEARVLALAMGGVQAHAAEVIKSGKTERGLRINVSATSAHPEGLAAFWGAKQATGWNAGGDKPNLPDWVGIAWKVGTAGEGPYAVNDAIAAKRDDVVKSWAQAVEDLAREAGFH